MAVLPSSTRRYSHNHGVVIDGASLLSVEGGERSGADLLIAWVRSCPRRSNIHVYLPRFQKQPSEARRLQSTLQALGCTVTMRLSNLSPA